jgi:hypothetical protein
MRFTYKITQVRVSQPEQHAHALGRRERQIEPSDSGRTARAAQRSPVARVQPGQHVAKRLGRDVAAEPELACGRADPLSPSLTRRQVVVLDPVAHALRHVDTSLRLVEVVLGLAGRQLADRENGCGPLIVKPTSEARRQADSPKWRAALVAATAAVPRSEVGRQDGRASHPSVQGCAADDEPLVDWRRVRARSTPSTLTGWDACDPLHHMGSTTRD